MSSPDQISDDDESFDQIDLAATEKESDLNEIIDISSDDTVDYFTSDDEELPSVNVKRSAVIKNLFPTKPEPSSSQLNDTTRKTETLSTRQLQPVPSCSSYFNTTTMTLPSKPKVPEFEKTIGGVKVKLPVQPYGSQTVLMFKLITAINKYQNCLLESPTGSGKTLALLCGALAWLQQEQNRVAQMQAQQFVQQYPELNALDRVEDYIANPTRYAPDQLFVTPEFGKRTIYDKPSQKSDGNSSSKRQEPMEECCDEFSCNGEVTIHKKRKLNGTPEWKTTSPKTTPEKSIEINHPRTPEEVRVPTIYYGARTHKQLQQVIKEFSRTSYCGDIKMTVLSSREHSCIREFDRSLWKTKNDMCRGCAKKDQSEVEKSPSQKKKKEETNCKYYNNRQAIDHNTLPPAFDLEDLVAAGHDKMACPYYAARDMAKTAHIVFCPYNYLIEPGIRSSLSINLEGNIVIIDEAHNIEDICRDAASCTITWETVKSCIAEMEICTNYRYANADALNYFDYLLATLRNWDQWFNNQQPLVSSKPVNNNEAVHTWAVDHFVTTLDNHNIGEKQYKKFTEAAEIFCRKLRDNPGSLYGVTQITGTLIETLDMVLGYMFRESGRFKDDFKPLLVRTVSGGDLPDSKKWRNSQFNQWVEKDSLSLRLLCLNPAVVFSLVQSARCVILASGTLTPLVSLHSELGAPFPLRVSPNHIIPSDRVWVGTLSSCPDGSTLECTSRYTNSCSVQDALGDTILHVSRVTPHGVLCFLSSYSLLNKLHDRWKETGLWKQLTDRKHVFMECRNSRDHNDIMEDYYKYVSSKKGALLFAVYRGKVSEGMDFKDHQARAVITVGVPFPNMHDLGVQEKMKYNDKYAADRGLLPSREWLRVQAYRALNQAVGRCVRHSRDWGAVLLVDARFNQPYYTEHLSKWVRAFLGDNHHTYKTLVNGPNSLECFMQRMTLQDSEDI